jgi:hypothetical protein
MDASSESAANLSRKIAEVISRLKPFQALEYDPATGVVSIITELLVPYDDIDQIADLLSRRRDDETVTVKRYAENFKISLVRRLKL